MTEAAVSIPGNEHALAELRQILDSGHAVAFVGAGASAGLYPLWETLLRNLADEALNRGSARSEDHQYWLDLAKSHPQQTVRAIKGVLGDGTYAQILREIFRPRAGEDGRYFTPVHGTLIRLPFRGYVTTNYDPGLLEARIALRPDSRATGYATWKDRESVQLWLTGEIFSEQPCPLLFAHGIYERSDTIILSAEDYREAYRTGVWRRLFERLWGEERLVFVGFGFSDPWLDFMTDKVITQTDARMTNEPRHVALIGLLENQPYSPQMRSFFRDQYNASVVFYRITSTNGKETHSQLLHLLNELITSDTPPFRASGISFPLPITGGPPQSWVHKTTEDDLYVERADALHRLNRWADDSKVRTIAVTGLGGIGKTSLIGYWLKKAGGAGRRAHLGLFFWSFYADRDVQAFLAALLQFASRELGIETSKELLNTEDRVVKILRQNSLLLVLDGLEVLQERPGTPSYGALLSDDLRELLDAACRAPQGLIVLTSRFPFPDLMPHLGASLRVLDLDRLTPTEGAALLQRCGVGGRSCDRKEVSLSLEGHPLGLRIFAAALQSQVDGDPTRFVRFLFEESGLKEQDPLERKLRHLLMFYEQHLPSERTAILGIVSLFRTPIEAKSIFTLARRMPSTRQAMGTISDGRLMRELDALCNDHLLLREHGRIADSFSCHPVLRDHFRRSLLEHDRTVATSFADLLRDRPARGHVTNRQEVESAVSMIDILLEAGEIRRANEIYLFGLQNGQAFRLFLALHEGFQCTLGFVANETRRAQLCENFLSSRLGFYLNGAAFFAALTGELASAASLYRDAVENERRVGKKVNLAIYLQNYTDLLVQLGHLDHAEMITREALALTKGLGKQNLCNALSYTGEVLALQGRTREAMEHFEKANMIEEASNSSRVSPLYNLHSLSGIQWGDFLLRLNQIQHAHRIAVSNLEISARNQWHEDVALNYWILARAELAQNRMKSATEHIVSAEELLRRAHQYQDLPKILLTRADLERQREEWESALRTLDEALRIAAPREMRLAHADALVLRGRVLLERARRNIGSRSVQTEIESAGDDGDNALTLARHCGYAWAERDALALLADSAFALGDTTRAASFRREADALSAKLQRGE